MALELIYSLIREHTHTHTNIRLYTLMIISRSFCSLPDSYKFTPDYVYRPFIYVRSLGRNQTHMQYPLKHLRVFQNDGKGRENFLSTNRKKDHYSPVLLSNFVKDFQCAFTIYDIDLHTSAICIQLKRNVFTTKKSFREKGDCTKLTNRNAWISTGTWLTEQFLINIYFFSLYLSLSEWYFLEEIGPQYIWWEFLKLFLLILCRIEFET